MIFRSPFKRPGFNGSLGFSPPKSAHRGATQQPAVDHRLVSDGTRDARPAVPHLCSSGSDGAGGGLQASDGSVVL